MKEKHNGIIITGIISVVILIVAIMAMSTFSGVTGEDTVQVQGQAVVKAMPDLMSVYFNVETKGDTTEDARVANVEVVDKMIASLTDLGFERNEIVTENLNINENCEWKESGRECDGFKASHSVKIEVGIEDTELMGKAVDAGVSAGAMLNYVNFELTQESQNKYKAEAMKVAAKDAKVKAESVALGFDKKVGKLVNVQVNDFNYYPWRAYGGNEMMLDAVSAKESVSNIQPGEKEVSASVSATYKLR